MNKPIGSIGPTGTAGPADTMLEQTVAAVVDFADTEPGYAPVAFESIKPHPLLAERECLAKDRARSADTDAPAQNNGSLLRTGSPAPGTAQPALSIAGIVDRGVPGPLRRLFVEVGPMKKDDRRRKRSC
jgi:hypothetical protein